MIFHCIYKSAVSTSNYPKQRNIFIVKTLPVCGWDSKKSLISTQFSNWPRQSETQTFTNFLQTVSSLYERKTAIYKPPKKTNQEHDSPKFTEIDIT